MSSQNCLPDEKMALRKALPDKSLALKRHNRTGIGLSNIITDGSAQFLSVNDIWELNSCPAMYSWEPFSRLVNNFDSPKISQTYIFCILLSCKIFPFEPLIRGEKPTFQLLKFVFAQSLWKIILNHRRSLQLPALWSWYWDCNRVVSTFSFVKCISAGHYLVLVDQSSS